MHITVDAARYAAAVYDVPGQAAWRVRVGGSYLLSLGGIAAGHGSMELLEAHALVVLEQPALADVHLVLAGTDPEADPAYLAAFRARAAELGTAPVVIGAVSRRDQPTLVAGASGFVHLPATYDGCVLPLQALAAGVPVVARDLPEVRRVLGDAVAYGDTVLSIADAVIDVLTDPPEPDEGIALAAAWDSEDRVVEQQPDRGDRRQQ
ncbi:glycosyltransferase [Nocardioides sp. MH1]|uniref:glycosyltransferase n=1 Tax=Nocardioides sp. MH1 TaxID=3242490 RepID=UPI003522A3FA